MSNTYKINLYCKNCNNHWEHTQAKGTLANLLFIKCPKCECFTARRTWEKPIPFPKPFSPSIFPAPPPPPLVPPRPSPPIPPKWKEKPLKPTTRPFIIYCDVSPDWRKIIK